MGNLPPVLDQVDRILKCASVNDVWALHTERMSTYGFDRLLYLTTRFRAHGRWGDSADMLVLSNYDKSIVDRYVGKGLHKRANMVPREKSKPGAYSWREFLERQKRGEITEAEKKLGDLRTKWEMNAGYTIWFDEISERNKSVIGLCANRKLSQDNVDSLWSEKGNEILLLNNIVHLKISQLPHTGGRNPLTKRQREVLQWVADGKTVNDIAQIMLLSPVTVEKHLRLAREAFGAETTGQAVRKASILNQLFLIKAV
jgi:DNA-binding CsgD family transcriptional regulator